MVSADLSKQIIKRILSSKGSPPLQSDSPLPSFPLTFCIVFSDFSKIQNKQAKSTPTTRENISPKILTSLPPPSLGQENVELGVVGVDLGVDLVVVGVDLVVDGVDLGRNDIVF